MLPQLNTNYDLIGQAAFVNVEFDDRWQTTGIIHQIVAENFVFNRYDAIMGTDYEFDVLAFLPDWYKKS